MRCLKSVVFSCFIVLFFSQAGRGQDPFYWKLTDENGLPSQTVYQVLQDHYGLIWIATANGLCTFDGKYVQNFDCSALNDQEILKIQEGPDGKIWGLNLSGQLFCFSNGKIEVINELGGVKLGKLTDFYLFQNKLFFGDFVGVGRSSNFFCYDFDTYSTTIFNFNLRGMLFSIVQSESNLILYTRSSFYGNIFLLDTKLNYKFKLVDSVYLPSTKHICFYNDKLLVPMENGKIKFLNLLTKNSDIELSVSSPTKNIINIAGFLYFIQSKGVVKTDLKNKVQLFSEVTINSIFKDREGNYFFSSNQGVLIQPSTSILGKNFHSITYSDKKINSIARLNSKVVLFADESGRLYENKNLQRKNYYFSSINSVTINSITGEKVIGADNGLFLSESKKPIVKTSIKCTFSARNCIYFGASQIFGKVVGSSYEVIKQVRTYAIAQTKDGLIWVGSDKGIYTYDGKNVMPYINQENNAHVPYRVTDMKTDASGRLWVTTLGHGVLVIVNNKIEKTFNKAQKLSTNTVNCVAFDNSYTWLGSDKGVYRCEYTKMEFLNINKYFGLPSDDIFALCPNKNELFIGTSKGLVLMPYEVMKPNMVPPNIRLNRVMVNDSIMPLSQNKFDLGRHENNLFIEYVSYQYRSKGEARYEYRIPELDTDWTMTDQRFLKFTNLSSGSYHLEIRAVNECDVRSTDFIRLHFDIAKPIWLQWWFVVGCVFAAGGGAWLFTFNNFKRKEKQQKKESEFKAKIEDLRIQALQAQMNPHFIFNSLNAVQHYLSQNDHNSAIKYLSKFANLIRIVFEFSKRREISLSSELEMLELYMGLEQLRFNKNLEIIYDVSKEIKDMQESILLPPLLIQPIIENSFRHGLFHKIDNGKLIVKFELFQQIYLKCTIEDNGVGRVKAASMPSWKPAQYSSSGLTSTRDRIKYWHQKNNTGITDSFIIEDLYHQNIACGTRVTMIF